MPRIVAYLTSIWLPKAPARRMRSTCSIPSRQLDRAHVRLRDLHLGHASMQHIRERPSVGDDPRRSSRHPAVEHAILIDDAGKIHFGDDFDDPGTAHAADITERCRPLEGGIVRP
jgi:hypothetical protein